ncbi:acetyltransferase (GNAT) family protein [Algoriphagus aquaeductus]|uniref:Acetyltransferase (GNAT) family protein n=1 Tax=Algoriphagus aquaeductus TaxID=475299 RepID=A0A326RZN5_9BACT|nr:MULTISPECIES: GNAT family N-acetyltransferase [Algoriphagus]MBC6368150.1 GNAT family N-acetyltransferase [Algoriphagus sp. AK58]PZV82821.1 acetyltransferase (GNAT) family protein [Algoriphagus aquaeductus]
MKDMLVRLMELPDASELEKRLLEKEKIVFRRAIAPEKHLVSEWVMEQFGAYWKSEVEVAFSRQPVSCWIAQRGNELLGFACYECTARNFFGPTGTKESERGKGIGKVLLIKSLESLREMGYAYAIIGGVGPAEFYEKAVGAKIIEGSEVSIYQHLLRKS